MALTLTFASFVPYTTYALPRSSHPKPHETPSPVEGHKAKNLKPRTFKRKLLRPKARAVTFLNLCLEILDLAAPCSQSKGVCSLSFPDLVICLMVPG